MEREDDKPTLTTPLIQVCEEEGNGPENGRDMRKAIQRGEVIEEVKKQLWLAGPLVSVSLLLFCLQMISVMFVGHLGELSLSGASMATSFATVTGFSLLVSLGHLCKFIVFFELYGYGKPLCFLSTTSS